VVLLSVPPPHSPGAPLLRAAGPPPGPPDDPGELRRKSIYFRDGQVVFASSSDPADRLGPILLQHGFLGEQELARCSAFVGGGRPLGQVLVDEGILSPGQLYEAVTLQVKEIFLRAFLETSGEFAFLEGPADEQSQVKLAERTRDLVLQGMKRVEEAEQRRAMEAGDAGEEGGAGEAGEILIEVEAPTLTPAPAARAASGAGSTESSRQRVPPASGPFETYRRIFRRVYAGLAAVEGDAARRLDSYFERLPERKRPIFEGVRVGQDGEIDVARVLANVEASGAYKGAAARARSLEALEELLAFALFEAKNRLPRAAAEQLLREVGRMQVGKA
jgi:hypothetical protein